MRYLFGFLCVLALGFMGCSETSGTGGSGGSAGSGGTAGTGGTVPCEGGVCDDGEECIWGNCYAGDCSVVEEGAPCAAPALWDSFPGLCSGDYCLFECEVLEEGSACHQEDGMSVCIDGSCTGRCDNDEDCGEDSDLEECVTIACVTVGDIGVCDYHAPVTDGTPCAGGACQDGMCELASLVLPCTDQGIRNALLAGGGPYTFDCDGPTTVTLRATLAIERDVALDGEGNLTLDLSNSEEDVIIVSNDAVVGLYGITVTGGTEAGIRNDSGRVALVNSTVSGNGDGIHNNGDTMTLIGVTVSDNTCSDDRLCTGVGIQNRGTMTLVNCTVSDNDGGAIRNFGGVHGQGLSVLNSTVSGAIDVESGMVAFTNTLIDGTCAAGPVVSNGYNIESPGNTCGFDQTDDQPRVSAGQLNLQPLADNGGPTETHALGVGSVAIDQIPEAECVDAEGAPLTTDQRGFPRDSMCDVGAFEVQP